ncbi:MULTISPECIES: helicase-associated domain-containing protein [unclassified Nonomuraea]|uniref:helicase-associated domain-containing protein n=1 Tax=unclassified Nonomuraea TaxID=2593643 RepID=UPI0033FBAFF8
MDETFLGWLAGLGRERLAELLAARPDVLRPVPPRRLAELAERLDAPESVHLALSRTPLPCLLLVEAILVSARSGRPLSELVAAGADLPGLIDRLERVALVRRGEGGALHLAAGMPAVLPAPLGLGPGLASVLTHVTVAELTDVHRRLGGRGTARKAVLVESITAALADPERLARQVAHAPAGTRELLDDFLQRGPGRVLDEFPARGHRRQRAAASPVQWAADHGLIWSVDWERTYVMPMEVALALRGRDYRVELPSGPPAVRTRPVAADLVAHEASVAALRLLDRAAALLQAAAGEPLPELKGGGVGVKEVRRLASRLSCDEDEVRLLLDLTHAAGLLGANPVTQVRTRRATETRRTGVSPTKGFDAWLRLSPAGRYVALVEAWWRLPISPTRRYDGKPRLPLAPAGTGTPSSVIREVVFGLLPGAASVVDAEEVARAASWHLPLVQRESCREVVLAVLAESRLLGLVGADALSPPGLALRATLPALSVQEGAGEKAAPGGVDEAAEGLLAGARQTALFGTDLTAVVTGPPAAALAEVLDRAADREPGGSWRFGPSSVRRALDAGHTADGLVAALAEVASGPLPQPLTYLIHDVARRHGEIGVVPVGCCVVGDDHALLAELAAHRSLAKLRPRLLAPTVLASALDPAQTLALLREAGYAPVAREADGSLAVASRKPRRAPVAPARREQAVLSPERAAAWLVTTAGEPTPVLQGIREVFARYATALPPKARERVAMELQYHGTARIVHDGEELTISGPEVRGADLDVWCHEPAEFRRLDLAEITKVLT